MQNKMYCKRCFSVLVNLKQCDGCHYNFEGNNDANIINGENRPFKYYLYGILPALFTGLVTYTIIFTFFSGDDVMKKLGASLFVLTPFFAGTTLGYFLKPIQNFVKRGLLAIATVLLFAIGIYVADMSGLACVAVLLIVFVVPLSLGMIAGRYCRLWTAKHLSETLQSSPLIFFILIPILFGSIEEQYFQFTPTHTVETHVTIEAPQLMVWDALRFFEHVKQEPPLLLRIGLPRPVKAIGNHKNIGEITSCEYQGGGFIKKKITNIVDQQELTFEIIEQSLHFEHDLTLRGGSILLSPGKDGGTLVTMRTHYDSYVRPSWFWERSMDEVIKTLHRYVIKDIELDIQSDLAKLDTTIEKH